MLKASKASYEVITIVIIITIKDNSEVSYEVVIIVIIIKGNLNRFKAFSNVIVIVIIKEIVIIIAKNNFLRIKQA